MRFFYTGAKSFNVEQKNIDLSLGGFLSSTQIPNSFTNNIFSDISKIGRRKGYVETKGIVLKNTLGTDVSNVFLYQTYPVANGKNYTAGTTVQISGDGIGATAHPVISGGKITSIVIDTAGSGYTVATITITDTTGIGAIATATISTGNIASIDLSLDCLVKLEWAAVSLVGGQQMEKLSDFRALPYVGTFVEPNLVGGKVLLTSSLVNNTGIGLWVKRTILLPDPEDAITSPNLAAYLAAQSMSEDIVVSLEYT